MKNDINKIQLTNKEAQELINELKKRANNELLDFPTRGNKIEFEVCGIKKSNDKYIINITRSNINDEKCNYQGRVERSNIPLMRLDITDGSHRNPDGKKIVGNHLHIYNENYELSYAIPFDVEREDLFGYCMEFFKKFNLVADENNFNIIYQIGIN